MALRQSALATLDAPQFVKARAIVASAQKIDITSRAEVERVKKAHEIWQDQAWAYCDLIGPLKFAQRFMENAISRVRFFPACQPDPEQPPVSVDDAANPKAEDTEPFISESLAEAAQIELSRIKSKSAGLSEIIGRMGMHQFVAGESYVIAQDDDDGNESWGAYSSSQVGVDAAGSVYIRDAPGSSTGTDVKDDSFFLRAWREHGQFSNLADSNMRSILGECEEYIVLARSIRATGKSRLSNGVLLVPSELSFTSDQTKNEDEGNSAEDDFDKDLLESMTMPIQDEGAASAVVPLVIRGPAEFLKEIRHLQLERTIDPSVLDRCQFLIGRMVAGLDLPNEVISGVGDVNHWGAWQIDENKFKDHIEPNILPLTSALTTGFLRGALIEQGFKPEEVAKIVIWHDATDLVTHPNRANDAKDLHTKNALSDEALRRETGFSEEDAPSDEELAKRLGLQSSLNEQIAIALLKLSGILPPGTTSPPSPGSGQVEVILPGETPNTPEDPSSADGGPPDAQNASAVVAAIGTGGKENPYKELGKQLAAIDRELQKRLLIATDVAMSRTLEKAGAKLRSKATKEMKDAVSTTPNERVGSVLGKAIVAAIDPDDDVIDESFGGLKQRYDWWVARAHSKALGLIRQAAPDDRLSNEELDHAEQRQMQARSDGWDVLNVGLVGLAGSLLFDPSPNVPTAGEFDETIQVPPGLIRESLAVAGGTQGVEQGENGRILSNAGTTPTGGAVTGDFIRELFGQVGAIVDSYIWVYGEGDRTREFGPHRDLDGVQFNDWQDPVLAVTDEGAWLDVDFYSPGDHSYCQCDFETVLVAQPQGDQETEGDDEQ